MEPFSEIPNNPMTLAEEQKLACVGTDEAKTELVMRSLHEAILYGREVSKGTLPDTELLSLAYVALTRAAKNFRSGKQRFFTYAKVYCRGQIFKAMRGLDVVKDAYLHETPLEDCGSSPEDKKMEPDFHEPEFELIDLKEIWQQVEPIMNKVLSDNERAVFTLRYSSGYTFKGIGRLLGVSGSAAEGSHSRALKKIRRALVGKKALFTSE